MKYLTRIFEARLKVSLGIIMFALGLLISPTAIMANDTDNDLVLEEWMVTPFDYSLEEFQLTMESWMLTPFDNSMEEMEITMESWMTAPFDSESEEEEVITEEWMRTAWI